MNPEERVAAVAALRQMVVDSGDTETIEELYELCVVGIRFFAAPRSADADFHLHWNGVDWDLVEGPVPLPPSPQHWWRGVQMRALRYGIRLPMTPPTESIKHWEAGAAMGWYVHEHLEEDLGIAKSKRRIPSMDQMTNGRTKCKMHHEPIINGHCPVVGCT